MFEQGYITACMRSVTTNKEVVYRPSTICKRYLIAARSQIQQKSTFDFSHLTQTINQLGRRYCNMIRTSLTTHTETRQLRAIRIDLKKTFPKWSKSALSYTTKYVQSSINNVQHPNASLYKDPIVQTLDLTNNTYVQSLIQSHIKHLHPFLYTADIIVGPYKGYMKETNIERYPHMFFPYIVFLFQTIESIINKAPFQIIPQYTMKARSLTIGKEQLTEIVLRLAKSGKLDDGSILVPFKIGDIPTVKDCAQTKKRKREEAYENNVQGLAKKRARLELLQDRCLNEKDMRKRTVLEQSTTRLTVTIAHTEAKLKLKHYYTTNETYHIL